MSLRKLRVSDALPLFLYITLLDMRHIIIDDKSNNKWEWKITITRILISIPINYSFGNSMIAEDIQTIESQFTKKVMTHNLLSDMYSI